MTPISSQVLSDGTLVLRPTGSVTVNAESDAGLLSAFDEALENGHLLIALDLSEIDYMDSSGFAALVRGWTRVRRAGGDVVLSRPTQSVRHLLKITRLMTVLKTSETMDEGLDLLRRQADYLHH
jgi:anti-sigma B factor antagonist